jgi:hypothetical protein
VYTLLDIYLSQSFKNIEQHVIDKITKKDIHIDNIFNGTINNKNIYQLKNQFNDILRLISYNDKKELTYFYFHPGYSPNEIFDIFTKELNLSGYTYRHSLNNVFMNTDKFEYIKDLSPDYRYFNLNIKTDRKLHNKTTINLKFNNNHERCLENGYLRVYDCGHRLFRI